MTRTQGGRLFAPDTLRGLIIAVMALDHASLFVAQGHPSGEYWGGPFPVYDDPLAFLTRFVTHFCAPGFFLLMGLGMVLFARTRQERGWTKWQIMRHFLIRGGTLIALQFLVVNQAWNLSVGGWDVQIYAGVLFALGGAMIVGSLLLWLGPGLLLGLTLALLIGTELLVPDPGAWGTGMSASTLLLLLPGGITDPDGGAWLWSNYQTLPWLEMATLGMVFGHWLAEDPRKAFSRAWKVGLVCLVAFLGVRYLDGFGNIRPRMGNGGIDFFNLVKYPPSIAFTLLTTGGNLCLLWLLSRAGEHAQRTLRPLVVFGQAPLFFYVQHLFLYAMLGHLFAPDGTSIPAMAFFWLLGLLILYPLCLAYGWFRRRQPAHSGLRLVWDLVITVSGPLGLVAYWLDDRQSSAPAWQRALGATIYSVLGNSAGLLLLIIVCYVFFPESSTGPLVLLAPLLVGWLAFRAPLLAARLGIGYPRAAGRALLTEVISTCLVMAGLFPALYLGVIHWMGGQNDLAQPLWWGIVTLTAPVGALVAYPFHLWLAHRELDGRAPGRDRHRTTPSLRNAWAALLLSAVLLVASLGLTMGLAAPDGSAAQGTEAQEAATRAPHGCTVFTVSKGEQVFFGGNDDYIKLDSYYWVDRPNETDYGVIWIGKPDNVQQGVNEKGLAYDANGLPRVDVNPHPERIRVTGGYGSYPIQILHECATVAEVVAWVQTHEWHDYMHDQMQFADAGGDAVIISAGTDGELVFTRKPPGDGFLVSTNFNVADPGNGYGYPCSRYDRAQSLLGRLVRREAELTARDAAGVLDAVHQEGGTSWTLESLIADLPNGVVYLYYFHQFDRPVVVDVAQELADPRPPGPLSQLFPADVQEEAARRHQHILAGADRCQQTGVAWVILVLICLVLLIVLSARSRRGWALWVPAVVVLGPLGLLAWLLAGRRREPAGWRAAVVEATGDVIPTAMAFVAALVVLVLVPAVLASQPLQLVLMLGVPPVAGWLFFQAPALALATGKGYLRTLRQRLPQALVAAGLGLGGIVAVSLPLVNRIANTCGVLPLHAGTVATWWAIVIPGALAGGLLLFLYELWAVRRGYHAWRVLAWGEGQVHSPPWRTVWWWILLSCVILLGGLVVGAAL